jgi:hypothetical protein
LRIIDGEDSIAYPLPLPVYASPNGPAIRKIRGFGVVNVGAHPERGLMLIYLLDPYEAGMPEGFPPVVAFGMSFPASHSGMKVEYKVNNVLWEQEYGPAE